jgi:hypothetical protein
MFVVNIGRGGEDVEEMEIVGSAVREENCREPLRVRLDREKDEVRLEIMPIVRDLGIGGWFLEGEIGPRSLRVLGCTFSRRS